MRVSILEVPNQKAALKVLVRLVEESSVDPLVRNAALAITNDCEQRDDSCEIHAIFDAIKHGDDRVKGLERGLKYVSDPRWADFFSTPSRTLRQLAAGYNGEDCDGHVALAVCLLATLGFLVGLRAWGRTKGEYTHVYGVVAFPKHEPNEWVALDTTVDDSEVGWEPEGGYTLTAYADGT